MQVIEFNVRNQRLTRYTSGLIAEGSYKYLKFKFNFHSEDWLKSELRIVNFSYRGRTYPVPLDANNLCLVPSEVLHSPEFKVSLYGGGITTNAVKIPVERNNMYHDYTDPSYDEAINKLSAIVNTKADNIVYDKKNKTIQLESNGLPIGDAVESVIGDGKTGGIYVPNVTPDNILEFTLQDTPTENYYEFDIDVSNDWVDDETGDDVSSSNYTWEEE